MPFDVRDQEELLRLLRERPEWRAAVRRELLASLTDAERRELQQALGLAELADLPALIRQQGAHLAALAEAQARTAQQLATLTARLDQLTQRVDQLAQRVDQLAARVGQLDGEVLESRYRTRAPAYLSRLARRVRAWEVARVADLLDDALDAGRLSADERDQALLVDLVATGRLRAGPGDDADQEVLFVLEVSAGIGPDDVRRAANRAAIFARLGYHARPVAAGRAITAEAASLARELGVVTLLDGAAALA